MACRQARAWILERETTRWRKRRGIVAELRGLGSFLPTPAELQWLDYARDAGLYAVAGLV